jgi:hypothetical protein
MTPGAYYERLDSFSLVTMCSVCEGNGSTQAVSVLRRGSLNVTRTALTRVDRLEDMMDRHGAVNSPH